MNLLPKVEGGDCRDLESARNTLCLMFKSGIRACATGQYINLENSSIKLEFELISQGL